VSQDGAARLDLFQQHVAIAVYHREQVIEIVRHSPSQPPHAFQSLGVLELLLKQPPFFLRPQTFSDIASDA
jgi:hypothetical protein